MMKDLSADNVFYKRRVEELGQKLQEQNELIISQKQQVQLAGVGGGRSGRWGGVGGVLHGGPVGSPITLRTQV